MRGLGAKTVHHGEVSEQPERPSHAPPGHDAWIERTATGNRWHARCSCGWNDPATVGTKAQQYRTDAVERFALARAVKHVTSIIGANKRSEIESRRQVRRGSTNVSHPPGTLGAGT